MGETEKLGRALISLGEALINESSQRRYRQRQRLGPDWQKWPIWAQKELLAHLRSLDRKPAVN